MEQTGIEKDTQKQHALEVRLFRYIPKAQHKHQTEHS